MQTNPQVPLKQNKELEPYEEVLILLESISQKLNFEAENERTG